MEWIELVVHTTTTGSDTVSDLLMQEGATGTMVEDRADVPDPTKPNGIWEIIDPAMLDQMPEDVLVHAWFEPGPAFTDAFSDLKARLAAIRLTSGDEFGTLQAETKNVKDEDWSEVWKQFYKPFKAGQHLVVKPSWESYDPAPDDKIIEIDPGMAFGSGQHETTGMCLELLERNIREGDTVIDVGTGSGILAIGAALTGAGHVVAIDIDPDAVKVARENVEHNALSDQITVLEGNLLEKNDTVCNVCIANIIADVICFFADPLNDHIVPGGLFICSGIIREREKDVEEALLKANYTILETVYRGEWVAFLARRHS